MRRYWFGPFSTALIGLAWASPAVIALPERAARRSARGLHALRVRHVGDLCRRYRRAPPVLLRVADPDALVGIVFIASGDRVTRLLGFAVPIYFVVMTSLHHEVHAVVVSELQLREHNDEANAQLREANGQLSSRRCATS